MNLTDSKDFSNESATIVKFSAKEQLNQVLNLLGLQSGQRTLVLTGGAGGMSTEEIVRIQTFFEHILVPFIDKNDLAVIDGGTNTGVMEAIGVARSRLRARFPLIGVLVEVLARRTPGMLQKNHTHFVLTPGSKWGDDVVWLSALASVLAGKAPSLTLLINGGEIAWQDASASVEAKRPILVAEGTGRTADAISRARLGLSSEPRAVELLKNKLVVVVNPFTQPEIFIQNIKQFLHIQGG